MTASPATVARAVKIRQDAAKASVVLVFSTDTASAAAKASRRAAAEARAAEQAALPFWAAGRACPGSEGEISSGTCRTVYGDHCGCW